MTWHKRHAQNCAISFFLRLHALCSLRFTWLVRIFFRVYVFLSLLLSVHVAIDSRVQCPPLSVPVNGRLINQCLNVAGSSCSFECVSPNFKLNGNVTLQCMLDGRWSSSPPTCDRVEDSPPDDTSNGNGIRCFDINPPVNGLLRYVTVC